MTREYGTPDAPFVLLQPADEYDLSGMENEAAVIRSLTDVPFRLLALPVDRWNRDLSPWQAPAVFGKEPFGDGAEETLRKLLPLCGDKEKTYLLGGYSLAGLFSLWAAGRTDVFAGVAAASPSLWFPGFVPYLAEHPVRCGAVCLSVGDKEEKARNRVLASVGDRIRETKSLLEEQGVRCTLQIHPGNHFQEPDVRTAKAFAWVLDRTAHPTT